MFVRSNIRLDMPQRALKPILTLLVLMIYGCAPVKIDGKSESLAPANIVTSATAPSVPVHFHLDGTKTLNHRLQYATYARGGGGYIFDFSDAAKGAAITAIDKNFLRNDARNGSFWIDLVFSDLDVHVSCRKGFFTITCGGSSKISASLLLKSPNGRSSTELLSVYSDDSEESEGIACEVVPNEAEKNFNSAFKNLMTAVIAKASEFIEADN
ncbi:MAG: hypothetical protein OXT06_27390 [Rhodospirillaceae bacterium]|nr:hypothetical protein [Rhodospirillaceae bacterium]MDD9914136.1 hypothetical protein [Rhodospirillaceae bacterium]MDD9929338.1 hypothetical protein [Rhodospirillaceae bacterium]